MNDWRRVAGRGTYVMVVRGAVLAQVALIARNGSSEAASEAAFGFGISSLLNLASSFGLPTVLVRRLKAGRSHEAGAALAIYFLLNAVSGAATVFVLMCSGQKPDVAVAFGFFTFAAGVYTVGEYLALGLGNYDRLLRGFAPYHLVLVLASIGWCGLSVDVFQSVMTLAAAHFSAFGVLAFISRSEWLGAIKLTIATPMGGAIRDAVGVGIGSALGALHWSVDLVVAKPTLPAPAFVTLRIVMMAVGAAVALVPLDFFIVAQSASGVEMPGRSVARACFASGGLALAATIVLAYSADVATSSMFLWTAAATTLGALRMATRACLAGLNGRGAHTVASCLSASIVIPLYLLSWLAVEESGVGAFVGILLLAELCYAALALRLVRRGGERTDRATAADTGTWTTAVE